MVSNQGLFHFGVKVSYSLGVAEEVTFVATKNNPKQNTLALDLSTKIVWLHRDYPNKTHLNVQSWVFI